MIKEARFKELTDDTGRKHYRVSFFIHGADEEAIALLSNKLRGFLCFDIDRDACEFARFFIDEKEAKNIFKALYDDYTINQR